MVNLGSKLEALITRVSRFLLLVSGILVLMMAWIVSYAVVKRYAFHAPDPYAYELSVIFLLFCGVLAFAAVEDMDRHVRNDILSSRFSRNCHLILMDVIFPILALFFVVILTWKSWADAMYALQIDQVSNSPLALPLGPIKIVIPLGYGLLCLVLIKKIFRGVFRLKLERKQEISL